MSPSIFVRNMSRHRIIRAEASRLPKENGDRDITVQFDAPGIQFSSPQTRPVLSYRIKPGDQLVQLKISINGTNVVDQTLSDPAMRTLNGVVEPGVIDDEDNELRIFVPADRPGSVVVSDLILIYSADVEISLPDPNAPPPPGNGF